MAINNQPMTAPAPAPQPVPTLTMGTPSTAPVGVSEDHLVGKSAEWMVDHWDKAVKPLIS